MKPLLDVQQLNKQFLLHEQNKNILSCQRVSLQVFPGQLTAITGATGCGKSSVLKCIYRTYLPTAGRVRYTDASGVTWDLTQARDDEMLALRRRDIGFVTQFLHCLPRRAALQVVMDPLLQTGVNQDTARQEAARLLRLLGISETLWNVPPATFSGGEKQRINLARGLIARPRLLLLDEPTASLDAATTDRVVELLRMIKEEGVGMLAIFHQRHLVDELADHHIHLSPTTTESPTAEPSC